jgi:hypothetical protein
MLVLVNQQIDVLLLCQSLRDEERRGILETAHAITPATKCAFFENDGREVAVNGELIFDRLNGPDTLRKAIDSILHGITSEGLPF